MNDTWLRMPLGTESIPTKDLQVLCACGDCRPKDRKPETRARKNHSRKTVNVENNMSDRSRTLVVGFTLEPVEALPPSQQERAAMRRSIQCQAIDQFWESRAAIVRVNPDFDSESPTYGDCERFEQQLRTAIRKAALPIRVTRRDGDIYLVRDVGKDVPTGEETVNARPVCDDDTQEQLAWGIAKIADATGLSSGFLRNEIRAGSLKARHVGRRVLVLRRDLDEYLEGSEEYESKPPFEAPDPLALTH